MHPIAEYVCEVTSAATQRGASDGIHRRDMSFEVTRMVEALGLEYFRHIDRSTAEPHEFGEPPDLGSVEGFASLLGAAINGTFRGGIDREPGTLLYARMVTADYQENPEIGLCLRYAETVGQNPVAHQGLVSVGVYRKPVDPEELVKADIPNNITLRGGRLEATGDYDDDLRSIVGKLHEELKGNLRK